MAPVVTPAELPSGFVEHLRPVLGAELDDFLDALARPRTRALRWNGAKVDPVVRPGLLPIDTDAVPWCADGELLAPGVALGGHPAHLAGLFYLQEPTAMAPVEALAPRPGWRVADLAAAPGGKTTQLSALVGSEGLVVANDVNRKRLRALHDNLDLWGADNVITTNRSLAELASLAGEGFDGVVLDAPCTGDALFRRDPSAMRHWSPAAVEGSARRQAELLPQAASLVRPGGVLVYATCSFSPSENEERVAEFLDHHPGWVLDDCVTLLESAAPGLTRAPYATELTARFWPHKVEGEGQFVARLRHDGDHPRLAAPADGAGWAPTSPRPGARRGRGREGASAGRRWSSDQRPARSGSASRSGWESERRPGGGSRADDAEAVRDGWARFRRRSLWTFDPSPDRLVVDGDGLWLRPAAPAPVEGLQPVRPGLPLGRLRPGRFAPSPGLAPALTEADVIETRSWEGDDDRLSAVLRGEAVPDDGPDGWVLVAFRGWGVAWGHRTGGVLKNHVPPHLRRQAAAYQRRLDSA